MSLEKKILVQDKRHVERLILVLVTAALGLFIFGDPAFAAEGSFRDDSIGYRFGTAFKEPGVADGKDIQKNIVNFTHFNTDSLGSNFFTVDALFSRGNDPTEDGTQGATEFYAIFRRDWSLSQITGQNFSGWGIIRDVALHMGGDMNTKDVTFAPRKKLLVIGPELQFALPSGYFNLAFDYSKEWNHNGIVGKNVSFDPAFEMEATWGIRTEKELGAHPKRGASWEGYVIEELFKRIQPDEGYFWATHNRAELDLLLIKDGKKIGFEIKLSDRPSLTPSMRIAVRDLKLKHLFVIYPGKKDYKLDSYTQVLSIAHLNKI